MLAAGMLAWCCPIVLADDFAIRTQVITGQSERSVTDNVTIFHAGKIYDFAETDPREITVFDTLTRSFILAQPQYQLQTLLSADEVLHFAAAQQARAQQSRSELVRFTANPTFAESFDAATGRLSLTSPVWDYQVETQRLENREMLKRYIEFANWYTHLNALFRPVPPAVRLELNRLLDQHESIPLRVVVRIKRAGQVVVEQQSRHQLITPLGELELARLEQWERDRTSCRTVGFAEYRAASVPKSSAADHD
jgi:hypothetical protein